jgi:hypothetical protein
MQREIERKTHAVVLDTKGSDGTSEGVRLEESGSGGASTTSNK